jgi:hypothetical protein
MLRRLRETGTVVLVPLAWSFATAAHVGAIGGRSVLVAHVVMDVLLAGFAVLSYSDMTEGVLRAWWWVIAVGFVVTAAGTATLVSSMPNRTVLGAVVLAWILVPGAALAYTGRHVERAARVYLAGAAACLLGAAVYAVSLGGPAGTTLQVAGLVVVGLGQTAGIVAAVVWR